MYHIDVFGFSRQNSILESVGEVTISKMTFRFFAQDQRISPWRKS